MKNFHVYDYDYTHYKDMIKLWREKQKEILNNRDKYSMDSGIDVDLFDENISDEMIILKFKEAEYYLNAGNLETPVVTKEDVSEAENK